MVTSGKLNAGQGFAIEYVITFALVLVVYAAACDDFNAPNVKGSAPLAIGLAIAIGHLFAVCVIKFISSIWIAKGGINHSEYNFILC